MTAVQREQLATAIEMRFGNYLDLSSVPPDQRTTVLRTRGLAALAVQLLSGEDAVAAAGSVIDGFGDNGVDALYVDEATPRLILVQSKWHAGGQKCINLGETHKFLAGLQAITDEQYDRFNGLLDALAPRISAVLRRPGLQVELVVATNGVQGFSSHVQQAFDDIRSDFNEPDEMLKVRLVNLADLHDFVLETTESTGVDLTVSIRNWGMFREPYDARYGTMKAAQVVDWHRAYGDRLFSRNIRKALGMTQVNQRLIGTLEQEARHFWYFNNGITILCRRISQGGVGRRLRQHAAFFLTGVSVVNGAQTVASIAEAARRSPESVADAWVLVRIISLEDCPESFAADVTRATNTQNMVVERDFVALDPLQNRLRRDFALTLRKTYVIKRGEESPRAEDGCGVDEATMALACAHPDVRYAVLAHSSPSSLWDMSDGGHYRALFPADLSAVAVWRWVCALRDIDRALSTVAASLSGRAHAVARQCDRLVAHIVLSRIDRNGIDDIAVDWDKHVEHLEATTTQVFNAVLDHAVTDFKDVHTPTLFKNTGKCRQLAAMVAADLATNPVTVPTVDSIPAAPAEAREHIQFHLSGRGVSARGHLLRNGFVVKAGSLAARDAVASLSYTPSIVDRREWLVSDGALAPAAGMPGLFVLTRDEYFESPSQASGVMLGRPSNGRTDWRTSEGLSLNQALSDLGR